MPSAAVCAAGGVHPAVPAAADHNERVGRPLSGTQPGVRGQQQIGLLVRVKIAHPQQVARLQTKLRLQTRPLRVRASRRLGFELLVLQPLVTDGQSRARLRKHPQELLGGEPRVDDDDIRAIHAAVDDQAAVQAAQTARPGWRSAGAGAKTGA